MIEYFKLIYLLVTLKNRIFKNTIFKSENWSKIIALILFFLVFLNTLQSSAFIVQFVKDNFDQNSVLFRPLFEIILFIVFIFNIISTLTLSGSDHSHNFLRTLAIYPIKFNRIIFYEIITGLIDIITLLFLPLYVGTIFLSGIMIGWINSFAIFLILFLFLFSISNIISLLRNTINLISFGKHSKILMMFFTFSAGFVLVLILKQIPNILTNTNTLVSVAEYIKLFPTSVFTSVLLGSSSDFYYNFIIASLYFVILNSMFFLLNIYSAKLLRKKSFGKIYHKFSIKKSILTRLFIDVRVNPFSKKDAAYTLRSIRTMPSHLMILLFLVLISVTSFKQSGLNNQNLADRFSLPFLFISMIVLSFSANAFAFEGRSIINYFYRPISSNATLKSKMFISNFYFIIISAGNLLIMLFSKTKLLDLLFFEVVYLLGYIILLAYAFPLSIYFPKNVNFTAMSGFLTSLPSLFIFIVLALVTWLGFYGVFQFYLTSQFRLMILLAVGLFILLIIYYRAKIFAIIGRLLSSRKEKVIQIFR